jgi:hypothetical protein
MMQSSSFTLFGLIRIAFVMAGIVIGGSWGSAWFGSVGGFTGGALGVIVGYIIGGVPYALSIRTLQNSLDKETDLQLRDRIASGKEYYISHLLLAQLMKRGQDVTDMLPSIVDLLESESSDRRRFGWGSLKFAFPEIASKISTFHPNGDLQERTKLLARLKLPSEQKPELKSAGR